MSACAQALNDNEGTGDDTSDGPETGVADASDGGHHNYLDSGNGGGDTGSGQQGDAAPVGQDSSVPTQDAAPPKDSSVPDTSVPDTSVPDTSTGGGTDCPSDALHIAEAVVAASDPSTPTCSAGSDCASGMCCFGSLAVCIPQ